MIIRLWTTRIVASCATQYDAFADSRSLSMFETLEGCLGVIFLRSDERGFVFSFWKDANSIEALKDSEVYQNTVNDIVAQGFLEEPQTTELLNLTGGFLTQEVSAAFADFGLNSLFSK